MADYITTHGKIHFTPMHPVMEDIHIEDIAHALSLMTRANGHFPEFFSVAQHSIQCCKEAAGRDMPSRLVLACLLHDASEAYLADITRPVKKNLSAYLKTEEVLQNMIYQKFLGSLPNQEERKAIALIDDSLLSHEFFHYMGEKLFEKELPIVTKPLFREEPFRVVEEQFLQLFWQYQGKNP